MSETNTNNIVQAKEEIQTILTKYNVALIPTVIHQGDQTFSRIDIVPRQPAAEAVAPAAEGIEETVS
jgi:hypothetical protein